MAQPEKNMAEVTNLGSEAGPVQTEGQKTPQMFSTEQVRANAQLPPEKRLEAAEKLLGAPLTEVQKETLSKMHEVGSEDPQAGVYKYTREQIEEKIRKGKEAFTKEQWKALIRAGYAGRLPSDDSTRSDIDPASYTNDLIKRVMTQVQRIVSGGNADEVFLDRMAANIESAYLAGNAPEAESLRALTELQQLTIYAKEPGARPRPPEDPLYPDAVRERIESETPVDTFRRTRAMYEYYASIDIGSLPTNLQTEIRNRMPILAAEIQNFIDEAEQEGLLVDVRARELEFYNEVKAARRREKYSGRTKQAIIDHARSRGGYQEFFWNDSPRLRQLMREYRGVAEYVWEGVVGEVEKEAKGIYDESSSVVGAEREFELLRERRIEARKSEKKYETNLYYGQRNYELTAENASELAQAVLDYVIDKIAELPRDPQNAHRLAQELGPRVLEMLGTNRNFLETEGHQDIPTTHPDYLRARYIAESVTYSLVTELMLYKGNIEAANSYRAEFANEFIAHHDAVYLENPYVAYMLHKITTHRDGTYWLGQPLDTEKLTDGQMENYRAMVEKEIKEMALSHTLFISEDQFGTRKEVVPDSTTGKPLRDAEGREVTKDLSYSFDDPIERLLLDLDGSVWGEREQELKTLGVSQTETDAAKERHDTRVAVFRKIKQERDVEDGLVGMTPDQRKNAIRAKIVNQMQGIGIDCDFEFREKTEQAIADMTAARAAVDVHKYDEVMWKWVEEYNKYLTKFNVTGSTNILADPKWYPSGWDMVRMKIDRSTKMLDRGLSAEEFEAMFEPIRLIPGYDKSKTAHERRRNEAKFAFQLAKSYQVMWLQDAMLGGMRTRLIDINTGLYTGRLMDDEASLLLGLIRPRVDPITGQPIIDPQTQKVIYDVVNPNQKIIRIADIVQARLEAAIKEEATDIEQAKAAKAAAIASGNQQQIETTTKTLRDLLVNAQFLATHVLKEKGLIEGRLPAWPYHLLDENSLPVFMNALADYGVETADFIPIGHEDKDLFYEIAERGRRALKAEWDRVVAEHMETRYIVAARNPDGSIKRDANEKIVQAESLWRAAGGFGGEKGTKMRRRYRMINKGGNNQNRKVVDSRFEPSTSGGIRIVELIPEQTDIGLYTLLIWEGVLDIRELHGYIHRQDEVEYHDHKYFHVMDPINYVDSLSAAYPALNGFSSGKNWEGKNVPGVGQEPFHGGFKTADYLIDQFKFAVDHNMSDFIQYLTLMQAYRHSDLSSYSDFIDKYEGQVKFPVMQIDSKQNAATRKEVARQRLGTDLERYRQMSYLELPKLTKKEQDEFYSTLYGVYDYYQDYLKGLRPVQTSRRKEAPRNWQEDNNKKFYDFRRKMRAAIQGKRRANGEWDTTPDAGFILRRGYSPEVASEIAIRMLETVLREADYTILEANEVVRRKKDGEDILIAALKETDRKAGNTNNMDNGFEKRVAGGTERVFVIPDQKDWDKIIDPDIKKALEKIRRRGLLDFMMEEGYNIGDKEILGQKVPSLVQQMMKAQKSNRVMNTFDPGETLKYKYTNE